MAAVHVTAFVIEADAEDGVERHGRPRGQVARAERAS